MTSDIPVLQIASTHVHVGIIVAYANVCSTGDLVDILKWWENVPVFVVGKATAAAGRTRLYVMTRVGSV